MKDKQFQRTHRTRAGCFALRKRSIFMYFSAKHAQRIKEKQKHWEQRTRTRNRKDKTRGANKAQNRKKKINLHQNIAEASWFPSKSWQVSKDDVPDAPPMYKMVMACSFQVRNKWRRNSFQLKSLGQRQILCFSPTLTNILKKSLGHFSCSLEQSFPVYLDFMRKIFFNPQALSIALMPDPVEKTSKIRQNEITKSGTTGAMRAKPKRTAGPSWMCWRYQN